MMANRSLNGIGRILIIASVPLVGCGAGCGTNFSDLAYQAGAAATRTAADLLLTDFYNAVADARDSAQEPTDQGDAGDNDSDGADDSDGDSNGDGNSNGGDGDTDGGGAGDGDGDGGPFDGLTGDAATGQSLFVDGGCNSCHCDDGSGGCALSAPAVNGVAADVLDGVLRGDAVHPVSSPELTDQDIVDLQAFLSSDDGGDVGGGEEPPSGDADNGMTIFAANGCGGCHCDDAGGGCALSAPPITGVALDTLDGIIRGDATHPFAKLDLSDEELNDLQAYLAGL